MAGRTKPPIRVFSVAFQHPGSRQAIPIRDPETMKLLGAEPEWTLGGRRHPAAYPGGSRPIVEVVFVRTPGAGVRSGETWEITARGHRGRPGLRPRRIRLDFDAQGRSGPHRFTMADPLPEGIGLYRTHWHWLGNSGRGVRRLGITRHQLYHTWRRPVSAKTWAITSEMKEDEGPPHRWVYLPLLRWTCQWAQGKDDPKAICDAILANLHRSQLKYGIGAWNVHSILQYGGGYCGGWYRMFQAMAGVQGVPVVRRSYLVDWRREARGQERWCAIVVKSPGLNRKRPVEHASRFHDSNIGPRRSQHLSPLRVRRYRFWGQPGGVGDGHCINFLRHRRRWYIYDASFRSRPVALSRFRLPKADPHRSVPVETLGDFKAAYLDHAVDHMLGSLYHGNQFFHTTHPDPMHPAFGSKITRNGLTVKTSIIPLEDRHITFYWTT